jgi:hypothetical protein
MSDEPPSGGSSHLTPQTTPCSLRRAPSSVVGRPPLRDARHLTPLALAPWSRHCCCWYPCRRRAVVCGTDPALCRSVRMTTSRIDDLPRHVLPHRGPTAPPRPRTADSSHGHDPAPPRLRVAAAALRHDCRPPLVIGKSAPPPSPAHVSRSARVAATAARPARPGVPRAVRCVVVASVLRACASSTTTALPRCRHLPPLPARPATSATTRDVSVCTDVQVFRAPPRLPHLLVFRHHRACRDIRVSPRVRVRRRDRTFRERLPSCPCLAPGADSVAVARFRRACRGTILR